MWVGVVSLFPEMIKTIAATGVMSRAIDTGGLRLEVFNPRDHAVDRHATVDDRPYGGGPGMVMMVEPLLAAINEAKTQAPEPPKVIYLSPQGRRLDQRAVVALAAEKAWCYWRVGTKVSMNGSWSFASTWSYRSATTS